MKKSTEPSKDEINIASASESKLSSKAEYFEKLRKENEVCTEKLHIRSYIFSSMTTYICTVCTLHLQFVKFIDVLI